MGVSSSQPIPNSQYEQPDTQPFTPTATPVRARRALTHTPTMDDEAASQQLMSEARAVHSTHRYDDAIPLSLDSANAAEPSRKKSKRSKKRDRSDKPNKLERKHLAGSQISSTILPSTALTDLQAVVAESPSKSQVVRSTAPSTRVEVPDTQLSDEPSPDTAKSKLKRRKRKREVEGDSQDGLIPATPHKEAGEGQRRKKRQAQAPVHNIDADATEVGSTPGATQETSSQLASREGQDGAAPAPLTPQVLLQNLRAERVQRSQGSQSNGTPTSAQRMQKAADPTPALRDVEEHILYSEEGLPAAPSVEAAAGPTGVTQSPNQDKGTKEINNILEEPKPDCDTSAGNLDDTLSQNFAPDDIDATDPTESHRKDKKRKRKLTKPSHIDKGSRYSVGGHPKTPSKKPCKHDPNKNYERARDEDDRTAADKALESSNDLRHPPELRTNGEYSLDEIELLRRAIRDFQQREDLDTADLVRIIQYIHNSEYDRETDATDKSGNDYYRQSVTFWDEVKGAGLKRNMKNVKAHVRATYHTHQRGSWSTEEDEQLRRLVHVYPNRWKLIAEEMNRLRRDVFNRWNDYVQHGEGRVTKRWSLEEEESFVKVLSTVCQRTEDYRAETGQPPHDDYLSVINWSEVCKEMGNTRSRLQCQYKLKQMRARIPPPTFDIELKPRQNPPFDEIDAESERDDQVDEEDAHLVNLRRTKKKQNGVVSAEKQSKRQAKKQVRKEQFKSKELISESDSAESEQEA